MSEETDRTTLTIERDDQWSAMCSGPRMEIVMALSALGRASVAELGCALDRAPDGLYHHLHVLERAGIARLVGQRRVGRQTESLYELTADELRFDVDFKAGRNTDRAIRLLDAHLRRARRLAEQAFRAGVASVDEPDRNTHVRGDLAWLDDAEVRRVHEIVGELRSLFDHAKRRRHGALHAFTLVFTPVHRERGSGARPTHRLEAMLEQQGDGS